MNSKILLENIRSYLSNGGLFNPELMPHDKVRDLILQCQDYITLSRDVVENLRKAHGTLRDCEDVIKGLRQRNEILSAKVETMDLFAQVLNTKPAERCISAAPDVLFQIVKRLEGM